MGGVHSNAPGNSLFFLREHLLKFYQKHNPKKIDKVDSILAGFGNYGVEEGSAILNVALVREYGVGLDVLSMKAQAQFNFNGKEKGDLSFRDGQVIEVTSSSGDWWHGRFTDGKGRKLSGNFPSNYVKVIESQAGGSSKIEEAEKRGNKLFRAVLELITTEYKYVQDLQIVMDVFVTPIERGFGGSLTKQIFSSWPELLLVHEQILSDMHKCLPDVRYVVEKFGNFPRPKNQHSAPSLFDGKDTSRSAKGLVDMIRLGEILDTILSIHEDRLATNTQLTERQRKTREKLLDDTVTKLSKVMIRMSNFLKTATPYIANYNSALSMLEKLHSTNADAERLIQACEQSSLVGTFHLRDFLIKPVQRVCKYPLLLKEIQTSATGEAKRSIEKAVSSVLLVADEVNEMVKQAENSNAQTMGEALSKLKPAEVVKTLDLAKPSSRLFRQGRIQVLLAPGGHAGRELPNKTNLYAFLFTEYILLSEEHVSKGVLNKGKTTYKVIIVIELAVALQATREEARYNNRTFALEINQNDVRQPTAHWVFTLASEAECDGWVADLAEALSITAADRARRSAVVEQDRERARARYQMQQQQSMQMMQQYQQMQNAQAAQYQQQQKLRQQQMGSPVARHVPSMYSVASAYSESPGAPRAPPRSPRQVQQRSPQNTQQLQMQQLQYRQQQQMGRAQQQQVLPTMNQVMWELNYTMNQHRQQQAMQQKQGHGGNHHGQHGRGHPAAAHGQHQRSPHGQPHNPSQLV